MEYINVNDFKTGVTIALEGNIYQVMEFQHVKPGKGAAFVKAKLRNLRSGSTVEHSFNSGVKVDTARIERKPMQYLYMMDNKYYFMNMTDFEQIELSEDQVGENKKYLKENLDVSITFYEGEVLGIMLPDKIELKVIETEPAVKGNTTNNALKDAKVETGYNVRVPLFIEQDETIIISTKDGKYVSRA